MRVPLLRAVAEYLPLVTCMTDAKETTKWERKVMDVASRLPSDWLHNSNN